MSAPNAEHPPVTVAVVSWNTRDLLAACLQSLHDDARSGIADVWVVDNASSDGSAELVRDGFPWVQLIASDTNIGFGPAVNLVASQTRSPWIVAANADTRVMGEALTSMLSEGERHPDAAVIAPRLILPDGSTQHSAFPFPTVPFTLAYCLGAIKLSGRLARHWCTDDGFQRDQAGEIPWAVGAFLLVRRSAWNQVDGFSADQWMYAEDLDLGWRLRRNGWTARYVPDARVHHVESAATTKAWGEARYLRWHASTYAWMFRRRGSIITRSVAAINVVGFVVRAACAYPAAALGADGAQRLVQRNLSAARAHAIGLRPRSMLRHAG